MQFKSIACCLATLLVIGSSGSLPAQIVVVDGTTDGAIEAELARETFTVTALDPVKRAFMLKGTDGKIRAVRCGKDVTNFDQIQVGDAIIVAIIESIAVAVYPNQSTPQASVVASLPDSALR